MSRRVLIIGGTGLISAAALPHLLARGDEVTLLTRGRSTRPIPPACRHIVVDRQDEASLDDAVRRLPEQDCVIDMVCYKPAEATSAARVFAGRTRQYLLCSTVDVYAKPNGATRYPIRENEPRLGLNPYGQDKVACETILESAAEDGAFQLTILRPAHTCDDTGALIHTFGWGTFWISRIREQQPIIVHGDGSSLWCVAHADDVGRAFAAAAGNPRTFGRAYNVSGTEWMTWNQLYLRAADTLGWPTPRLMHIPTVVLLQLAPGPASIVQSNFRFNNVFDTSPAERDLGFRCDISYAQMTERIIALLQSRGTIEPADRHPWYDALLDRWTELTRQLSSATGGAS